MRDFSLPRLMIVLWFWNYASFSFFTYFWGNGRHAILDAVVYSALFLVVELVCLGWIEDIPEK